MVQIIKKYFAKRYLPRSIVFIFDLLTVIITLFAAYVLRFNFDMVQAAKFFDLKQLLYVVPVFLISFSIVKPFTGILRHSTTRDITKIIFSLSIGGYVITFISWLQRNHIIIDISVIPYSVIIIHFALSTLFAVTARLLAKGIFTDLLKVGKNEKNIMIFGAGKLGQIARNALITDDTVNVKIIGFIDDNRSLHNKSAGGIPIYSVEQAFSKIVRQQKVTELIIAIDNNKLPVRRKREIVDLCLSQKLTLKQVPTVNFWINGSLLNLKASEIKKVQIEDLLGRDSITLDRDKIKEGVKDAVVLITGAAGSIGSEIVRQLILFKAAHIILLDKAESDLYNLQNEIWTSYKQYDFTAIVGDVTNEATLRKIFEKYSPSIVINAAAYKHVPLMEEFPCEAVRVNIGGTRNLANLSVEFGVKKFVQVSTDKAVNPTNVMGASKRISEIYIQALAQKHKSSTQFITTRFGNVLGSNGSVIPLFKKQIENGGPVTVTHEEITRFFMTIPEACMLVLEACFMAKGGEIFVFDMGEPVKIYNLAEKMIFLSGFIPHKDIKIEITGLRPGEKLYEELLTDQEDLQPTHNDKILIGKNTKHSYYAVNRHINQLLGNADVYTNQALVDYMHEIVPEFVSQNSYYTNHTLLPENLQLPLNSVLVTK